MKKLVAMMAINWLFICPAIANGEDECQVTDDLKISGNINTVNTQQGIVVLQGKLHNSSTYMEYKNIMVQAELCDENGNTIGLETFTLEEDVEKGETEQFEIDSRPLARIASVDYKVICAERDFAGLGY